MSSYRVSSIKRQGQNDRAQFQQIHLAVFPFDVQFLKTISFPTIYFFEKGNQILGSINDRPLQVGANQQGAKHIFSQQQQNSIFFRIHNDKNLIYKWSLYKQTQTGDHEYLQSCMFNLKQIITNIIMPLRSQSIKTHQSLINYSFIQKLFRCRFHSSGVMIRFMLIISNDHNKIKETIKRNYKVKNMKKYQNYPMIQFTSNTRFVSEKPKEIISAGKHKDQDNEDDVFLQGLSMVTDAEGNDNQEPAEIKILNKKSDPIKKDERKNHLEMNFTPRHQNKEPLQIINFNQQPSQPPVSVEPRIQFTDQNFKQIGYLHSKNVSEQNAKSLDLDQIILNEIEKKSHDILSLSRQDNSDLNFGIQIKKIVSESVQGISSSTNMLEIPTTGGTDKKRDYSILKLQSDSVKQQQIDIKLQNEQFLNLQVIEQQKTSIKNDIKSSNKLAFKKNQIANQNKQRKLQIETEKQEKMVKQNMFYSNLKIKNVLIFMLLLSIVILVVASALDSRQKKKGLKRLHKER